MGEACRECGFDGDAVPTAMLAAESEAEATRWRAALRVVADVRARPAPEVWSPLECACHIRDVFVLFARRVERMLDEDDPDLGWWDHDAAVEEERYNDQDPAVVLDQLEAGAAALAAAVGHVTGGGWDRTGVRRSGERFTVAGLVRFALHESHHHRGDAVGVRLAADADAADVGRVLAAGFLEDPVFRWLFPDQREHKIAPFFAFIAREVSVPMGATWISRDGTAVACWTPPDAEEWPEDRTVRFGATLAEVCSGDDLGRLATLGGLMHEHRPSEPHWYLPSIAVVPDRQGRGRGSALLTASLEPVDAVGLPAYLESSNDRNVPLYERFGFRTVDRVDLPDGPPLTLMWRP